MRFSEDTGCQFRLAIVGHLGRMDEAGRCLALLREFDPSVTVARISSRIPIRADDRIFYEDGLARAGVPR